MTVSAVLIIAEGARHQSVALAVMAAFAGVLGGLGRPRSAPLIGLLFWLFDNGFVIHRYGQLGWDGTTDLLRVAILSSAALAGSLLFKRILRSAHTFGPGRPTHGRVGERHAVLRPWEPGMPPADQPWHWN